MASVASSFGAPPEPNFTRHWVVLRGRSEHSLCHAAARVASKSFMSYAVVQRRLRRLLAGAAATGSMSGILQAVFDAPAKP
jgi:hypothetical protein